MQTCRIVMDLIPLYVEGLTNEESTALVEQHLRECSDCSSYYEMIRQDYQQQVARKPTQHRLDDLVAKLARYQQNIKLAGVLVAMLMSCIISGAGVQFLSTLPFIILTPFICRLYYHKSLPIILSTIPFGIIGGVLSEENSSFIPFFTVMSFLTTLIGVGAGVVVRRAFKQLKTLGKILYLLPAGVLLFISCGIYFSLCGNPIGYIDTMVKSKEYVNQTYEKGTLSFKGVTYNFKDNRHYGRFEYVLNGTRQVAPIGVYRDGGVNDYYKYVLESQFSEERSSDLKADIAAAINYAPVTIFSKPQAELSITRDDLNQRYYHLSYDLDKRNQATVRRLSESNKLQYEISFGAFADEYDILTKESFLEKAIAVQKTLQERDIPFHSIEMKAVDENGNLQRISFAKHDSEQHLINSYQVEEMSLGTKK